MEDCCGVGGGRAAFMKKMEEPEEPLVDWFVDANDVEDSTDEDDGGHNTRADYVTKD